MGFLRLAGYVLRPLGYTVLPTPLARPCAWGSDAVLGSFAPLSETNRIGDRAEYFIKVGYQHRPEPAYFDDTRHSDESQLEVYRFAREICRQNGLSTVVDIGCGSGYKLLKYLGDMKTTGVDVAETCQWLRRKYPDRDWKEISEFEKSDQPVDLVIAADVIEHVRDPDSFMSLIRRLGPRYVVLSTPDRNLLRDGSHNGPPTNPAHLREWSFIEFGAYVEEYFTLLEHFISCAPQATQCVLGRPKD